MQIGLSINDANMRKIEILGVGCPSCQKAEEGVRKAALSLGWTEGTDFIIDKVSEPGDIAARGILITPGVSVDDKIVSSGKVPRLKEILSWLK